MKWSYSHSYSSQEVRHRGGISVNNAYSTDDIESGSVIARSNITWYFKYYTPYLALTGELRGVFREDFGEKKRRYNGTAL